MMDGKTTANTYHVKVDNGSTEALKVLVEDALKLVVEQDRALVETKAAPRVEGTTLEL